MGEQITGLSVLEEETMPDKSPHKHEPKKQAKGATIKQKRAEKRAKHIVEGPADPVAHIKKRG
ncbi:hypothetical protein AHIS1636_34350 [Arthrobacter mangrovi]|uniref:Uncharacterized protein n=1 Tax=Arthrobacter mangrovi TaxID=2966350 RepID=A0ABQ5MYC7_9MICC|nr:hypothetical protein AHIS1636_34350 [Arthrobacter mangrovi]